MLTWNWACSTEYLGRLSNWKSEIVDITVLIYVGFNGPLEDFGGGSILFFFRDNAIWWPKSLRGIFWGWWKAFCGQKGSDTFFISAMRLLEASTRFGLMKWLGGIFSQSVGSGSGGSYWLDALGIIVVRGGWRWTRWLRVRNDGSLPLETFSGNEMFWGRIAYYSEVLQRGDMFFWALYMWQGSSQCWRDGGCKQSGPFRG